MDKGRNCSCLETIISDSIVTYTAQSLFIKTYCDWDSTVIKGKRTPNSVQVTNCTHKKKKIRDLEMWQRLL